MRRLFFAVLLFVTVPVLAAPPRKSRTVPRIYQYPNRTTYSYSHGGEIHSGSVIVPYSRFGNSTYLYYPSGQTQTVTRYGSELYIETVGPNYADFDRRQSAWEAEMRARNDRSRALTDRLIDSILND